MKRALFLAMFFAATTSIVAQDPDSQASSRSPKGTYQIAKGNAAQEDHELSIARRDRPNTFYRFYTYPRFAEVSFSPDESFLVISDHVGSGTTECVRLQRIDKPPFFGKPQKIDEACWKLFWSLHQKPRKIMYDHRSTYLCEWQDSSHFVVGLQGDHQIADPGAARWHLDGGWHCIYDAAHGKALANKYTDSKNSEFEFY